jgi:hypothetical protein
MKYTPKILFGTIVGVGLAPAVAVGLSFGSAGNSPVSHDVSQIGSPSPTPTASLKLHAGAVHTVPTKHTPSKVVIKTSATTSAKRLTAVANVDPTPSPTDSDVDTRPVATYTPPYREPVTDPTGSPSPREATSAEGGPNGPAAPPVVAGSTN